MNEKCLKNIALTLVLICGLSGVFWSAIMSFAENAWAAGIATNEIDCFGFDITKPGSNSELQCGDFYAYVNPEAKIESIIVSYLLTGSNDAKQLLVPYKMPVGRVPFGSTDRDPEIMAALKGNGIKIEKVEQLSVTGVRMKRDTSVFGARKDKKSIGTLDLPAEKFERIVHLEDYGAHCVPDSPMKINTKDKLCVFEYADCVAKNYESDKVVDASGEIWCAMDIKGQCPFYASECFRMKTDISSFPENFEYFTRTKYDELKTDIFDRTEKITTPQVEDAAVVK